MGFLPLLPSCGKSGKRMNYGIFVLLPSCGKNGKRMHYGIFATFAIMWQKWQKNELWDFCTFATFAIMCTFFHLGLGLMLACLPSGTDATASASQYMTQPSGIPILSPVLFMHVGDPYIHPFFCIIMPSSVHVARYLFLRASI